MRDSCQRDGVAKEVQRGDTQHGLLHIDLDAIVLEACEELAQVSEVGFLIKTGDEEVVNVVEPEGKALHNLIYEALECLVCILESKWHPCVLKQAKRSDYGCFQDFVRMDWDLVKYLHQVDVGENGGPASCEVNSWVRALRTR